MSTLIVGRIILLVMVAFNINLGAEASAKANDFFHRIITLHVRVSLLADAFSTAGYIQGRQTIGPLQGITVMALPHLGSLHRSCMWENIVLKNAFANKGLSSSSSATSSSEDIGNSAFSADAVLEASNNTITEGTTDQPTENKTDSNESKKPDDPRQKNAHALRHIVSQIPNSLGSFFQCTGIFSIRIKTEFRINKYRFYQLSQNHLCTIGAHLMNSKSNRLRLCRLPLRTFYSNI